MAIRQQLAVMTAKKPRPRLTNADRAFWVFLRRAWPRWQEVLTMVQPVTVVRWHRLGFKAYWRRKSRRGRPGRPITTREVRELIRLMAPESRDLRPGGNAAPSFGLDDLRLPRYRALDERESWLCRWLRSVDRTQDRGFGEGLRGMGSCGPAGSSPASGICSTLLLHRLASLLCTIVLHGRSAVV